MGKIHATDTTTKKQATCRHFIINNTPSAERHFQSVVQLQSANTGNYHEPNLLALDFYLPRGLLESQG